MARTREFSQELVDFVRGLYGPGKKHPNPHQLSLAMGRDPNAVSRLEETGNATPDVLLRLARAVGVSPISLFLESGFLEESDVPELGTLTAQQVRAAKVVGVLPDEITDGYLQVMEKLVPILPRLAAEQRERGFDDLQERSSSQ